jgi:hypothetical protein
MKQKILSAALTATLLSQIQIAEAINPWQEAYRGFSNMTRGFWNNRSHDDYYYPPPPYPYYEGGYGGYPYGYPPAYPPAASPSSAKDKEKMPPINSAPSNTYTLVPTYGATLPPSPPIHQLNSNSYPSFPIGNSATYASPSPVGTSTYNALPPLSPINSGNSNTYPPSPIGNPTTSMTYAPPLPPINSGNSNTYPPSPIGNPTTYTTPPPAGTSPYNAQPPFSSINLNNSMGYALPPPINNAAPLNNYQSTPSFVNSSGWQSNPPLAPNGSPQQIIPRALDSNKN